MDKQDLGESDFGKGDLGESELGESNFGKGDLGESDSARGNQEANDLDCGHEGRRHHSAWRLARVGTVAFAVAVLLPLCGGCSTDPGETRYSDVASLGRELTEAGLECELEYEGLEDGSREVSTCRIEDEFALLQIWSDEDLLAEFLESSDPPELPQAVGPNWIVDVETEGVARRVAETLGGTMRASREQ